MTNSNDKLAKLAINKSLLKEYRNSENDRIVYLKDGDEFQIQIFNPYQYVIGVRRADNQDRGFALMITSVTLLVICQVLPLIFTIVVRGWRG